jgi:hypothetical protein
MTVDTILRHLSNTGFHILGTDGSFIYIEDPSCIFRSFETFLNYAWIIITAITAMLLFGWAISMIRGAKNSADNFIINLRNLIIIFGTLTAVKPAINMIWGDDIFRYGCKTMKISLAEVQKILDTKNLNLENELYEDLQIYDSAANIAPLYLNQSDQEGSSTTDKLSNADKPSQASQNAQNKYSSNYIIYTDTNGNKYKKIGGSMAWRNNNPGNIRYTQFSRDVLGAIGQANGFSVFANTQTGTLGINKLLQTSTYQKLTVAGAINRYAPPFENNTAAYQKRLAQLTGVSLNKGMNTLTGPELDKVVNAIKQIEGSIPGKIEYIQ